MPSILGEQMFMLALAQYVKTQRETGGHVYTIEYRPVPYKQKVALKWCLLYSSLKFYGRDTLETMLIWLHLRS